MKSAHCCVGDEGEETSATRHEEGPLMIPLVVLQPGQFLLDVKPSMTLASELA